MGALRLVPSDGVSPALEITSERATLGRQADADLVVDDPSVSRRHALIERRGSDWVVTDQASANGTFLDAARVATSVLRNGQELRFGSRVFRVQIESAAMATVVVPAVVPARPPAVPTRPAEATMGRRPAPAGMWRDGTTLVLARTAVLPRRCVKCGKATSLSLRRQLYWHHPAIALLIFAGVLTYVIVALIVRKRFDLDVPICEQHRFRRQLLMGLGFATLVPAIGAGVFGVLRQSGLAFAIAGLCLLLGLVLSAVAGGSLISPRKIDDSFAWLRGVHRDLLTGLPTWPGPAAALVALASPASAGGGYSAGAPPPRPAEPTSGLATAAAVAGGLSIFLCPGPVAFGLGAAAIWDVQQSGKQGLGRAIFGLVAGLVASVALVLVFLSNLYQASKPVERRAVAAPSAAPVPAPKPPATSVVIQSKDQTLRIVTPPDWRSDTLNSKAELQACDAPQQACVVVLSDSKASAQGVTLERYSRATRGLILKNIASGDERGPKAIRIGAHDALQWELRGHVKTTNIVYLHTVVEGATRFYQIVAWTPDQLFAREQATLQRVVSSFDDSPPGPR